MAGQALLGKMIFWLAIAVPERQEGDLPDFDLKGKLLEVLYGIFSTALVEIQRFIMDTFVIMESALHNEAIAPWYGQYVLIANIFSILVFAGYASVTTWEMTFNLSGALTRVKELFPRFLVGMVMVNSSIYFCEFVIYINNLLITGLLEATTAREWLANLNYSNSPGNLLGMNIVMMIVLTASAMLLALVGQSREVLLYLLTLTAPISCLLWIIPETSGWFWMWLKELIAWTFSGFIQLTALIIGFAVLLGNRHDIYTKVGDFFAAVAIYTVMATLPFMVRQWVTAMFVKVRVLRGPAVL